VAGMVYGFIEKTINEGKASSRTKGRG